MTDVLVVGSGISGSLCAQGLLDAGASVLMLDVGRDDPLRNQIPDAPFSEVRSLDPRQSEYFLGPDLDSLAPRGVKVGAQLTPPRQYITRGAAGILPYQSDSFFPLVPVSLGGLGAGWGGACFTFSDDELQRAGLPVDGFRHFYQRAAEIIGVSAAGPDPDLWTGVAGHLPPLELDENAERIAAHAPDLSRQGMTLGRIPMAILSEDYRGREANPYFDLDFYGDARRSLFRPRYLIEEMERHAQFHFQRGRAVVRCESGSSGVVIRAVEVDTGRRERYEARRVVLCAGALQTARIVLNSLERPGVPLPILCNPYTYFPTVHWRMLGRPARDRRHSMAQLGGVLRRAGTAEVYGCYQMYSYRSLLLFRLVKEMPLPPPLGLLTARVLMNSLAIFGIFFADQQASSKWLRIDRLEQLRVPELRLEYALTEAEEQTRREHERIFRQGLRALGCYPIGRVDPGRAGSIHYAGTVPYRNPLTPEIHALPDDSVAGLPHVYLGDGSAWNFLPAKGLSFTLMANALRVASNVARNA